MRSEDRRMVTKNLLCSSKPTQDSEIWEQSSDLKNYVKPGQREWTSYLVRPGEKSEAVVGTRTKIYTKEKEPKSHGSSTTPTKNMKDTGPDAGGSKRATRGQSTSAGDTEETLPSVVTNVPALGRWRWHETADKCRWKGQLA